MWLKIMLMDIGDDGGGGRLYKRNKRLGWVGGVFKINNNVNCN